MDIKAIRTKLGLSQNDLAAILNVTQGAVWSWERGLTRPRKDKVAMINRLLDPKERVVVAAKPSYRPYTPPKRSKIKIDVWPYRRK